MSSEDDTSTSGDDQLPELEFDGRVDFNPWDDTEDKIDDIVEKIVNGETPELEGVLYKTESYDKIFEKIKDQTENANCMAYAAWCLTDEPPNRVERQRYLDRAIELGSLRALFYQGLEKCQRGMSQSGIEDGIRALRAGFTVEKRRGLHIHLPEYYSRILESQKSSLEAENQQLKARVRTLERELEEERLRPPEAGGSDYEKARSDFSQRQ